MQITDGKLISVENNDFMELAYGFLNIPQEVSVITTEAFQNVRGLLTGIIVENPDVIIENGAFKQLTLTTLQFYSTIYFSDDAFLDIGSAKFFITVMVDPEESNNNDTLLNLKTRLENISPSNTDEPMVTFLNSKTKKMILLDTVQSALPSNNDSTDNHSPHNINTNLIASIILGVSLTAIGIGVAALTFFIALNTVALAFGVGIGICVAVWGLGYLGKGIKEQLFDAPPDLALSAS